MSTIVSAMISAQWHDGPGPLVRPLPGAGMLILGDPGLLALAQSTGADEGISADTLTAALQSGSYDDLCFPSLVIAILERHPRRAMELLEDVPFVQIRLDNGTSQFLSCSDLLLLGVDPDTVENVSAAWAGTSLLVSAEWASGQGGLTWLWDTETQSVVWQTDEVHGRVARVSGLPLIVVHQCYSTYTSPPTNWLMAVRVGKAIKNTVISLDNTKWDTHPPDKDKGLWAAPTATALPRDPHGRSYESNAQLECMEGLQPLTRDEPPWIFQDHSRGLLHIRSHGLYGRDLVFTVPLDEILPPGTSVS